MQPKVRIFFFTENGTVDLAQILVAIECTVPSRGVVLKLNLAVLKEWSLKLRNVIVQVRRALPEEATVASDRFLIALFAKVNVDANRCFQSVTIDLILVAIVCNLVLNCTLKFGL